MIRCAYVFTTVYGHDTCLCLCVWDGGVCGCVLRLCLGQCVCLLRTLEMCQCCIIFGASRDVIS